MSALQEKLDPVSAFMVRSTTQQTTLRAAHLVRLSRELRGHLERGEDQLAGQIAGYLFKWSLLLLDEGADMRDVRLLIDLGAERPA